MLSARPSEQNAPPTQAEEGQRRLWIERLRLTGFRNYDTVSLELDRRPVLLTGPNGAGKTNLLEAISLLAPGRGLRRAAYAELLRADAADSAGWAVAAHVHGAEGPVDIGTGYHGGQDAGGRSVRIDGQPARSLGLLGTHVRMVWLTPAMDGLFTGPASERRRFLDRLVQSLDPAHAGVLGRFERAIRQRNRLLEEGAGGSAQYEGLELQIAESGVAIAAARVSLVERLRGQIGEAAMRGSAGAFPWAELSLEGLLENRVEREAAIDVEDAYRETLGSNRERDRAARRTLEGPHRTDLLVVFGPKAAQARHCSTGEQKALLIGLVLGHARLVAQQNAGMAPLVLLDEIAAHLDEFRRAALFEEITRLAIQAWMTGTDSLLFEPLGADGQFVTIENGGVQP